MIVIVGLFFTIIISLFIYLHGCHQHWKDLNFPYIQPEFFYGNVRGMGKSFVHADFWRKMYLKLKSKGPIGGVYLYYEAFAIITDLDLVKRILVKDFHNFPNRGLYWNEKDDPASANLFNIEDERWKTLRNKLTPAFTSAKLKNMFPIISQISNELISTMRREIDDENSLEVREILSRFATDVIGRSAFGIKCNSLLNQENEIFYKMGLKASKKFTFLKRILTANYPNLARKLRIRIIDEEAAEFYRNVIHETIKYRENNKVKDKNSDFMSLLMKMMNDDENPLTFNEICAQSVIFFLAGFETTATKLTFCLYELALHKNIQQIARESVREVLRQHNGKFTYEAVMQMEYLEQCINETLRKYSPAASARRVAKSDYLVPNSNLIIKKGTVVVIPVHGIHNDPQIYENPEQYNPNRFSSDEISKRHNFSFLPFGEGLRGCIGMRFAMLEMRIALAKILIEFDEFEIDECRMEVPMRFNLHKVLLSPAAGVYIKFK